jgi:effector-binding domain-containing protein
MFKIGEFSRISKVSIKTLHHYDELGILEPSRIDSFTNYRYYSAEQLITLNQILTFKEAGFSLSEIAEIFKNMPTKNSLICRLEEKVEILENFIKIEQDKLGRLRTNIFLIKNGGIPLMNEITIKKVEPILVASLRNTITNFDDMGTLWNDLNTYIDSKHITKVVPCMTLYYNGWDIRNGLDIEVIEPVAKNFHVNELVKVYELPSVNKMACIVHNGSFSTISKTCNTILNWIKENGYEIDGPVREIYHKGDWVTNDPNEYVTELQIPLKD